MAYLFFSNRKIPSSQTRVMGMIFCVEDGKNSRCNNGCLSSLAILFSVFIFHSPCFLFGHKYNVSGREYVAQEQ